MGIGAGSRPKDQDAQAETLRTRLRVQDCQKAGFLRSRRSSLTPDRLEAPHRAGASAYMEVAEWMPPGKRCELTMGPVGVCKGSVGGL